MISVLTVFDFSPLQLRVQAAGTDLSRPLDDAMTMTGVARWVIHRLWPGRRGDR